MLKLPEKYSYPFGSPNVRPLSNFELSNDFPLNKLLGYFGFESRVNRLRDTKTGLFIPQDLIGTSAWSGDGFRFDNGRFLLNTPKFNVGADATFILSFKTTTNDATFRHVISNRSASSGSVDNYSIELKSGKLYLWQTFSGTFNGQFTTIAVDDGGIKNIIIERASGQKPIFYVNGVKDIGTTAAGSWTGTAPDTSDKFAIGAQAYGTSGNSLDMTIRSFAVFDTLLANPLELSRDIYQILKPQIFPAYFIPEVAGLATRRYSLGLTGVG